MHVGVLAAPPARRRPVPGDRTVHLGSGHRPKPPRRARQQFVRMADAGGGALVPDQRPPCPRHRNRCPHRPQQGAVPLGRQHRRAVALVRQRLCPHRLAFPSRRPRSPVADPHHDHRPCHHERGARPHLDRHHAERDPVGRAARVHTGEVVLGARGVHLCARGHRVVDARGRREHISPAVPAAVLGRDRRRDDAGGQQPDVPDAVAGPRRVRHHAARVRRIGPVLHLGPLSLSPVRPGAGRARHGRGQHGRRRDGARRRPPHRRPERRVGALHQLHGDVRRPRDRRGRAVVERRRGRSAGLVRQPRRRANRAGATLLRGADRAGARSHPPLHRLARGDPRHLLPPARRGRTLRARAPGAGTAEVREPHRVRRRRRPRLQQPADWHPRQRRPARDAGAARLQPAPHGRSHRHRIAASRRSGVEDAGLCGRRPGGVRARRSRHPDTRDGGRARGLGDQALHAGLQESRARCRWSTPIRRRFGRSS